MSFGVKRPAYLPCTLEHNGVVTHFALSDAESSQESSDRHCSSTYGVLKNSMDLLNCIHGSLITTC